MATNPVDLDHLDKLYAEAAPGPWETHRGRTVPWISYEADVAGEILRNEVGGEEDAACIVALHNAYPALAAEIRRLRDALARIYQSDAPEVAKLRAEVSSLRSAKDAGKKSVDPDAKLLALRREVIGTVLPCVWDAQWLTVDDMVIKIDKLLDETP